ncbi:ROK family protein [Candidatus Saccharibacteria bacterium]|nr:ROK family protein [Candidatus Saccharibacteria bacterium]
MFLCIDIGGTKTLLALFSRCGVCLRRLKFKTSPSAETFLSTLEKNLKSFLPEKTRQKLLATTVAIPGVIKVEKNAYSFEFGNLEWKNIDLLSPLKELLNGKVFFVNDASLATLYETTRLGRKHGKSVYLTFSTGIGGGVSENGFLLPASDTFEPGHVKYEFNHKTLEWEDIASAKTLSEVYHSPLKELRLNDDIESDLVRRLSLGLLDIIEREDPDKIIVGGPLGFILKKIKRPLLNSLRTSVEVDMPKFRRARRPTESVIYGGFLYSKKHYRD